MEIENPADGSSIPIGNAELEVLIRDATADGVVLDIDGVETDVDYQVFNRAVTCDGCVGQLVRWKAIDTSAGSHELTVHATGPGGELGTATITAEFSNDPAIRRIAPQTYEGIGGIGQLDVRYGITARDPVVAQIVFGTPAAAMPTTSCRTECEVRRSARSRSSISVSAGRSHADDRGDRALGVQRRSPHFLVASTTAATTDPR